jgi:hypothetical protein
VSRTLLFPGWFRQPVHAGGGGGIVEGDSRLTEDGLERITEDGLHDRIVEGNPSFAELWHRLGGVVSRVADEAAGIAATTSEWGEEGERAASIPNGIEGEEHSGAMLDSGFYATGFTTLEDPVPGPRYHAGPTHRFGDLACVEWDVMPNGAFVPGLGSLPVRAMFSLLEGDGFPDWTSYAVMGIVTNGVVDCALPGHGITFGEDNNVAGKWGATIDPGVDGWPATDIDHTDDDSVLASISVDDPTAVEIDIWTPDGVRHSDTLNLVDAGTFEECFLGFSVHARFTAAWKLYDRPTTEGERLAAADIAIPHLRTGPFADEGA